MSEDERVTTPERRRSSQQGYVEFDGLYPEELGPYADFGDDEGEQYEEYYGGAEGEEDVAYDEEEEVYDPEETSSSSSDNDTRSSSPSPTDSDLPAELALRLVANNNSNQQNLKRKRNFAVTSMPNRASYFVDPNDIKRSSFSFFASPFSLVLLWSFENVQRVHRDLLCSLVAFGCRDMP